MVVFWFLLDEPISVALRHEFFLSVLIVLRRETFPALLFLLDLKSVNRCSDINLHLSPLYLSL